MKNKNIFFGFDQNVNPWDLGEQNGHTEERVRQIKNKALEKLKHSRDHPYLEII